MQCSKATAAILLLVGLGQPTAVVTFTMAKKAPTSSDLPSYGDLMSANENVIDDDMSILEIVRCRASESPFLTREPPRQAMEPAGEAVRSFHSGHEKVEIEQHTLDGESLGGRLLNASLDVEASVQRTNFPDRNAAYPTGTNSASTPDNTEAESAKRTVHGATQASLQVASETNVHKTQMDESASGFSLPGAYAENQSSGEQPSADTTSLTDATTAIPGAPEILEEGLFNAELVEYEHADIIQRDVILISAEEKERMARCKERLLAVIAGLVLLVGSASAIAFLTMGITAALQEQDDRFASAATETVQKIRNAFEEYVNAVALVHTRCRGRDFTRQNFRDLYEFLTDDSASNGLEFKAVQFLPNTSHAERPARETDSKAFYAKHYPHVNYRGFVGFNELNASSGLQPRKEEPWYFPIHWMEPVEGNEAAIDLDYHSSEVRIRAVEALFDNARPSLSDRLNLVKKEGSVSRCGNHDGPSYGVVLAHPGVNLTRTNDPSSPYSNLDDYGEEPSHYSSVLDYNASHPDAGFVDDVWPRDVAAMVICIPDLLRRSNVYQEQGKAVYIHDVNHLSPDPVFMGAAIFQAGKEASFLEEVPFDDLQSPSRCQDLKHQANVMAANRVWTVTVVALEGTYIPEYTFVILGSVVIFVSTSLLAFWIYKMSGTSGESQASERDELLVNQELNQ